MNPYMYGTTITKKNAKWKASINFLSGFHMEIESPTLDNITSLIETVGRNFPLGDQMFVFVDGDPNELARGTISSLVDEDSGEFLSYLVYKTGADEIEDAFSILSAAVRTLVAEDSKDAIAERFRVDPCGDLTG